MPRRARLSLPGIPWHIIQRGNNRSACFYTDEDYYRYLDTLKEQADKHGYLIHAYVLIQIMFIYCLHHRRRRVRRY
jgi:putative transposase